MFPGLFFVLLIGLPLLAASVPSQSLKLFDAFYRAGSLVFGGGHVVLPLLQASVVPPGWVSNDAFLAGYGAAQAVPGPLFTFAAYLGAVMGPQPNGWAGAALCLVAVFLPSFLLVIGTLPFWDQLRRHADRAGQCCGASTRLSSVCCSPRSTIRCGPRGSQVVSILRLPLPAFCCCLCGKSRPGWWWC